MNCTPKVRHKTFGVQFKSGDGRSVPEHGQRPEECDGSHHGDDHERAVPDVQRRQKRGEELPQRGHDGIEGQVPADVFLLATLHRQVVDQRNGQSEADTQQHGRNEQDGGLHGRGKQTVGERIADECGAEAALGRQLTLSWALCWLPRRP